MRAITLNGQPRPLADHPTTVADLIRDLGLQGKRIAVELNGEIVPRSRHAQTEVAPGDRLEIVAAVGGG
jgi:sulfur carrier protein